jgi:cysteinyl-tRNA synthetase
MSKSLGTGLSVSHFDNKPALRLCLLNAHYRSSLEFSDAIYNESVKSLDRIKNVLEKRGDFDANYPHTKKLPDDFINALNDDLNIPVAIASINKHLNDKSVDILHALSILGIDLSKIPQAQKVKISNKDKEYILKQIDLRNSAKQNKDYVLADKIRDNLALKNIHLIDTKDGTKYEVK